MSTFGIGPITLAGLVSTGDDVDAHDEARRARPVEVHGPRPRSPRRPTRPAAGGTARRSRRAIMPILAGELRVVPQTGPGRRRALDARHRGRRRQGRRRHRHRRRRPSTCRRGRRRTSACRSTTRRRSSQQDHRHARQVGRAGGPLDVPASTQMHADAEPGDRPAPARRHAADAAGLHGLADHPNDYRCFVLDPHFTKPTFITGYQVTPDSAPRSTTCRSSTSTPRRWPPARASVGQGRQAGLELLRRARRCRSAVRRRPHRDATERARGRAPRPRRLQPASPA